MSIIACLSIMHKHHERKHHRQEHDEDIERSRKHKKKRNEAEDEDKGFQDRNYDQVKKHKKKRKVIDNDEDIRKKQGSNHHEQERHENENQDEKRKNKRYRKDSSDSESSDDDKDLQKRLDTMFNNAADRMKKKRSRKEKDDFEGGDEMRIKKNKKDRREPVQSEESEDKRSESNDKEKDVSDDSDEPEVKEKCIDNKKRKEKDIDADNEDKRERRNTKVKEKTEDEPKDKERGRERKKKQKRNDRSSDVEEGRYEARDKDRRMAEGDGVYNDNIHVLKKVMGLMFNNRVFSDAVFTVKDQQFYVLSHLLSASSTILDGLITTHYEHCHDKDLKIYNVKHEDSFLLILKYIYGQPLDFQKTPVHIICEVLSLTDRYKLSEFYNGLKRFLSTLNCFELESAVVLLNTAWNYNISELYERVTVFVYEHAEQFVKHNTFPDLDYNVLTDLVKSDWFACPEIDILTGVLTWHSGMDKERQNWKTTTSQDDIQTETDDTSETDPTQSEDMDRDGEHIDHLELKQKDTCTSTDNSEQLVEKRDTCPEVMRLFSENILKKLLAQIRFPRMFASDLLKALKSDLGKNYIDILMDETHFSQSSESRQKYQAQSSEATTVQHRDNNSATVQHRVINNVTKVFQIQKKVFNIMYESEEEYLLGVFKWKICRKWTRDYTRNKFIFTVYLKFTSDNNQTNWECTVEYQLKWISRTSHYKNMILPDDNSYTTLTLTGDTSCVEIGKWEVDYGMWTVDWWRAFEPNNISTFHLDIKSMQTKMNVPKKDIHNVSLEPTVFNRGNNNAPTVQHRGNNNTTTAQHRVINNFTFQIKGFCWNSMHDSVEEYLFGDLKWKICMNFRWISTRKKDIVTMYLECTSDNNQKNWKCTVECQLKWISHDTRYKSMVYPDDNSYTTLTLTGDASFVEIGKWENNGGMSPDWWESFRPNYTCTLHLDIKSMQTKMMR